MRIVNTANQIANFTIFLKNDKITPIINTIIDTIASDGKLEKNFHITYNLYIILLTKFECEGNNSFHIFIFFKWIELPHS